MNWIEIKLNKYPIHQTYDLGVLVFGVHKINYYCYLIYL